MLYSKKGFTLFEIMIVLALIGVFFGITMSMNKDARTYQLSAERLANAIYDIVRTARSNMIIGRGVFSGSTMVVATERTIYLTSTGMISTYRNGTATGEETKLVERYFDNDPLYKISDIAVSSGGIIGGVTPTWDSSGTTLNIAITIASNADLSITGTGSDGSALTNPIRTLRITASYLGFEKSVLIDRITGAIEISPGRGIAPDGTVIMAPNITGTTLLQSLPPTYIITWDSQGGSSISSTTYTQGESFALPTPPTRSSYTLDGWYTAPTAGIQITTSTVPTTNTTYYARWTSTNPYAQCTAAGQTYTAMTTYGAGTANACDEADKIICTANGVGYTWAMCNVGSTVAGTTSTSYGSMFQWGRNVPFSGVPGSSVTTSSTQLTPSTLASSTAFIISQADWIAIQNDTLWGTTSNDTTATWINSTSANQDKMRGPCESGYHVPTYVEGYNTTTGVGCSAFDSCSSWMSVLKAPLSGVRDYSNSSLLYAGSDGFWWFASPQSPPWYSGSYSPSGRYIQWTSSRIINIYYKWRTNGFAVRCIKND